MFEMSDTSVSVTWGMVMCQCEKSGVRRYVFFRSVKRFGDSASEDMSGSIRRRKCGSLLIYFFLSSVNGKITEAY